MLRCTVPYALAGGMFAMLAAPPANAQDVSSEVNSAVEAARLRRPQLNVAIDKRTGLPSRITNLNFRGGPVVRSLAASSRNGEPSEADVRQAVEAFFQRSILKSAFPQGHQSAKRVIRSVNPDPTLPGQFIASVTQEVNGIPVFGSSAKVSVNRTLSVTGISASFSAVQLPDTDAVLDQTAAIARAREELGRMLARTRKSFGLDARRNSDVAANAEATASKTIFDPKIMARAQTSASETRLAWQVAIDSYRLFIDAKDGKLLYFYKDHRSFTVRRVFDLDGKSEFPGTDVINEETGSRAAGLSADAATAYQNSGIVRDFFFAMFGRKSFDNGQASAGQFGSPVVSYVRYGSMQGAHWCVAASDGCPAAHVAVYGPGYAKALDVMAHEFTHGVITHEADLVYAEESGAVNEALADILGSLVELEARGSAGNWIIGEHLPGRSLTEPERDLKQPWLVDGNGRSLFNAAAEYNFETNRGQPARYSDYVKRDDPLCESTSDYYNGCVHFNSGILNRFAYLAAEGGQQDGVTVTGIGRQKLGLLAYRALSTKMNQTTGLSDAAYGFVDSCYEFVSAKFGEFAEADCKEVENAQRAVGLEAAGS